jgi:hypothetical protein
MRNARQLYLYLLELCYFVGFYNQCCNKCHLHDHYLSPEIAYRKLFFHEIQLLQNFFLQAELLDFAR